MCTGVKLIEVDDGEMYVVDEVPRDLRSHLIPGMWLLRFRWLETTYGLEHPLFLPIRRIDEVLVQALSLVHPPMWVKCKRFEFHKKLDEAILEPPYADGHAPASFRDAFMETPVTLLDGNAEPNDLMADVRVAHQVYCALRRHELVTVELTRIAEYLDPKPTATWTMRENADNNAFLLREEAAGLRSIVDAQWSQIVNAVRQFLLDAANAFSEGQLDRAAQPLLHARVTIRLTLYLFDKLTRLRMANAPFCNNAFLFGEPDHARRREMVRTIREKLRDHLASGPVGLGEGAVRLVERVYEALSSAEGPNHNPMDIERTFITCLEHVANFRP